MSRKMTALLTIAIFLLDGLLCSAQEHKAPPMTRTANVTESIHGVTLTDPYRWLEDQDSPDTRAWIKSQNEYSASVLGAIPFRNRIRERLTQLLKIDTIGTPFARGGRYFLSKRRADQNQSVIYVRNALNGKDEVLLDPNTMSADQTTSVQIEDVSPDGKVLATACDRVAKTKSPSRSWTSTHVKSCRTGYLEVATTSRLNPTRLASTIRDSSTASAGESTITRWEAPRPRM